MFPHPPVALALGVWVRLGRSPLLSSLPLAQLFRGTIFWGAAYHVIVAPRAERSARGERQSNRAFQRFDSSLSTLGLNIGRRPDHTRGIMPKTRIKQGDAYTDGHCVSLSESVAFSTGECEERGSGDEFLEQGGWDYDYDLDVDIGSSDDCHQYHGHGDDSVSSDFEEDGYDDEFGGVEYDDCNDALPLDDAFGPLTKDDRRDGYDDEQRELRIPEGGASATADSLRIFVMSFRTSRPMRRNKLFTIGARARMPSTRSPAILKLCLLFFLAAAGYKQAFWIRSSLPFGIIDSLLRMCRGTQSH
eukprot:TRINITY_DN12703_c0_g1_i2.p1 TRINITY_DN12703_c0_g1~~TRINITY_DN12703_c0_g1_i2.p1  ORF type:complete len:303 (+),score=7.43 TRINITY_DN12703_c0_g1_i2:599-1507(+)